MENENDIQDVEETLDLPKVAEGEEEDTTDWKAEAEKLQQKAIRQREKTKELKAKLAEKEKLDIKATEPPKTSDEVKLNTGDKALLKAYKDIKGADELALVENWMSKYKLTPEELIEDEVFNSKLSKLREAKEVKDAIPVSTHRSAGSNNKAVDYWIDKPFSEVPQEFKREVLNARLERDEQKAKFGS